MTVRDARKESSEPMNVGIATTKSTGTSASAMVFAAYPTASEQAFIPLNDCDEKRAIDMEEVGNT
jgi:hypothetical protein